VSRATAMAEGHKPTPEQRRRAVVSAVVLAFLVVAIYLTFVLKVVA
jgi:hypothetical protein